MWSICSSAMRLDFCHLDFSLDSLTWSLEMISLGPLASFSASSRRLRFLSLTFSSFFRASARRAAASALTGSSSVPLIP